MLTAHILCATCTLISLGHNNAKISVRTCTIWIFLEEQANVWKGEHSEKLFSSPDPCAGKKCGHGEICLRDGPRSTCLCPPRCIGNRRVPRVCGTDGITYKNLCELLRTACIIGDTTLKMKHLHRCGSKPVVKPTTTTPPITQSPTGKLNNSCIACVYRNIDARKEFRRARVEHKEWLIRGRELLKLPKWIHNSIYAEHEPFVL